MLNKMEELYKPYVMLNGNWSYSEYKKLCKQLGVTPDRLLTTFTDRIGFLLAAQYNKPNENIYKSLADYSQQAMLEHHNMTLADVKISEPVMVGSETVTEVVIKPCCGGGKVL